MGITMLVSASQEANAEKPIEVTLLPITTLVSVEQKLNASEPIEVTLSGITTLVIELLK